MERIKIGIVIFTAIAILAGFVVFCSWVGGIGLDFTDMFRFWLSMSLLFGVPLAVVAGFTSE